MEKTEKKLLMKTYSEKLEKAIARELSIKKELENDKATLKYIEIQKTSSTPLEDSNFANYDEWTEFINKQIKKSENTLTNIGFKKVELEAVQYYVVNDN